MGRILSITFSSYYTLPRPQRSSARLVANAGISRDFGVGRKPGPSVNILAARHIDALQAAGYKVTPGVLGEDLVVTDLDLDALAPGGLLRLGSAAVLRVEAPRMPGAELAYIHPDFPAATLGHLGQLCTVVAEGHIHIGDPVFPLPPAGP